MYVYIAIWLAGFFAFVIMSIKNYKADIKNYLPKILPQNRRKAEKYMLLESLLFVLGPEIAMIWMASLPFIGIDNLDSWEFLGQLGIFAVIMVFSIGLSGIYGEKAQNLLPKEICDVSAE